MQRSLKPQSTGQHRGDPPIYEETKTNISKKLVKEYGEQTYRDRRYSGKSSYEDAAWSSVYVAEGCGQIESEEEKRFHAAIVKYAKTTRFPKNFL